MKVRDSGIPDELLWNSFFDPCFILSQVQLDNSITNVVEFGSGYGTFTIPASKIIKENIYAFDIEPEMSKPLREKVRKEKF